MPYVDRQNRICGFLDIEDNEACGKFLRRYFILDTQANSLLWYMDNPQNLAAGSKMVGSLQLTYISKVPKGGSLPLSTEVAKRPYKTEIIGGVVVHTPISNGGDGSGCEGGDVAAHPLLRRSQSYIPSTRAPAGPPVLKSGYCVKQGNVRKSWKRRYFVLDDFSISYFKCEQDKEPLRSILLKDVQKTHECLVKSGDLLTRDNLFEIITNNRTFYIQVKHLHGFSNHVLGSLGCAHRRLVVGRQQVALERAGTASPGSAAPTAMRLRQLGDEPKVAGKGPSTSGWLPWEPVPQPGGKPPPAAEEQAGPLKDSEFAALFSKGGRGASQDRRLRHKSEPQNFKEHPFPYDLDDKSIRTSDV
uniref:Pleckstrin homology domain containing A2 n=1 Tax=Varanus komodoensis TaxID=61221 RepID=A0A8D2LM32_VARKO